MTDNDVSLMHLAPLDNDHVTACLAIEIYDLSLATACFSHNILSGISNENSSQLMMLRAYHTAWFKLFGAP